MRTPYIVCNWKMNPASARVARVLARATARAHHDAKKKGTCIICAPTLFTAFVEQESIKNGVFVGVQDIGTHAQGAYTGQISARMARDAGARYALIGHSERRAYQHETDQEVAQKFQRAREEKLIPIVCVGENKKKTTASAWNVIKKQLDAILPYTCTAPYLIAYEPVWAIGGGKKVDARYAHDIIYRIKLYIRAKTKKIIPVLYGGSVDCETVQSFLYYTHTFDGFLVGSASVHIKTISSLIKMIYGAY